MNIPNLSGLTKLVGIGKAFVMANRPELLFGASVTATIGSVIMAARGGYQARGLIIDAEMDKGGPLQLKEKVQLTWLCYMPAAITTLGAVGATTGLHLVHVQEKKALATAGLAALNEARGELTAYKEKALALIEDDEKSADEKKQELEAVSSWREDVPWSSEFTPSDGTYQCWDDLANRPFRSNKELIRRASEVLLAEIHKHGKANLNLMYDELGMSESQLGQQLGWAREDVQGYGGKDGLDFVQFSLTEMPDGSSATAFWFREAPTSDYETRAKAAAPA